MKAIFLLVLLAGKIICSFSQRVNNNVPVVKTDYLQKSKNQKTAAWILLSGGAGLCIIGGAISISAVEEDPLGSAVGASSKFNSGEIVSAIGGLAMLGSIPLFIVASKNKHREMSLFIKNENAPQIQKNSFVYHPIPSLTLKLEL